MGFANEQQQRLAAVAAFFATAILVWFGNGLTPWWPLAWLAPLPILWFSLRSRWWSAWLAAGVAWLAGSVPILEYFQSQGISFLVWFGDYGGMALLFAAGVLLFRWLVLRGAIWSSLVALPVLWVSADWLRYWVTPHGTSADLAYTQLKFLPFLQLASLTGPWGMSFMVLLVPSAAATAMYLWAREPRQARRVVWVAGGLLVVVLGFGMVRLYVGESRETVRVGLIASDTPENERTADGGPEVTRLLAAYSAQARMLATRGAKVVVMPEKVALVRDADDGDVMAIFQPLADELHVTLVVGELHLSRASKPGPLQFNRAMIYAPGVAAASYDKEHLLPPFESRQTPGTAKMTMSRGRATWGVAICKDMDFTSMGRAYGRLDVGLMLVPAWDYNLDRTWHGHMGVMRGVENGFSVARAAKNGYLTVSDDRGRVVAETRSDSGPFATLLADVPVGHQHTLYQLFGDWFAWLAVVIFAGVIVRGLLLLHRKPGVSSR
jgi:apolipoprotein N-acyltransferase